MNYKIIANRLKYCLLGFTLVVGSFSMFVSAQSDQMPNCPIDTINGLIVYRYTVEKSEGLYRISKKFDVSQEDIIKLNPTIQSEGLKYGQKIYIPVSNRHVEPIDTVTYIYHVIQPKETLYSLSRKYGVSAKQIEQLNPDLVPNLPYGQTLRIPRTQRQVKAEITKPVAVLENDKQPVVRHIEQEPKDTAKVDTVRIIPKDTISAKPSVDTIAVKTTHDTIQVERADTMLVSNADSLAQSQPVADSTHVLPIIPLGDGFPTDFLNLQDSNEQIPMRVAYLLPLMLDATKRDANIDRFLEFYEGSLLAINDLQRQGLRLETYVFDIEKNDISLMAVLQRPELKNMDAIIGPAYPAQVQQVARFAKQERIPMIVPFTANVQGLDTNQYILRFNLSLQKEAEIMAQYIADNKHDLNVVFVDSEQDNNAESSQLLIEQLKAHKIPLQNVKIGGLKGALKKNKENLLIFKSSRRQDLQPYMDELISLTWDFRLSLVGLYNWGKTEMPLKMYYVSVFDANDVLKTDIYNEEFNHYYNYQLSNTRPRYDMLGYDITVFTFRLLFENQVENEQNKSLQDIVPAIQYHGIQSDIQFLPTHGSGGFVNQGHVEVLEADR